MREEETGCSDERCSKRNDQVHVRSRDRRGIMMDEMIMRQDDQMSGLKTIDQVHVRAEAEVENRMR